LDGYEHTWVLGYFELWTVVRGQVRQDISHGASLSDRVGKSSNFDAILDSADYSGGGSGEAALATLCIGSEWYTFPSYFFLPSSVRLEYIADGFGGVLPQHFARESGTSGRPIQPFNDQNREETGRYIAGGLAACDYLIRLMREDDRHIPQNDIFFDESLFTPIAVTKIIDSSKSPMLHRAFHIPGLAQLSQQKNSYFNYTLFRVNYRK
jgi:hypothetical protein